MVSPYDFPFPGGVTQHIINLTRIFRERGYTARILAVSSRWNRAQVPGTICLSRLVVPVPYNGSVARLGLSPCLAGRLRRVLQREAFDIVHVHEPANPTLPRLALCQAEQVCPQAARIGTFHAYREVRASRHLPAVLSRCAAALIEGGARRLDGCIAVSSAASQYAGRVVSGRPRLIPNGVDTARFGRPAGRTPPACADGLAILYVGRLEPRKGLASLIEAFARVKASLPEARLVVVGPYSAAERRPFERMAQRLRVSDVRFAGYVPDEALPGYYQSSAVFCAPSLGSESFGMVLLEAMAAGTPIVASDIEGYRAVIGHHRQGLLAPPRDGAALAEALLYLLQRPDLRRAMGRHGQITAANYTWERVADQVLEYYADVLDRKRGSR